MMYWGINVPLIELLLALNISATIFHKIYSGKKKSVVVRPQP